MSIDPRDLFVSLNPLGLDESELAKNSTGFADIRTHGDYLVFLAGYKAGTVDGEKRDCQSHRPINAEGCKPESSIQPSGTSSTCRSLDKAEGGTPDNNIHPERAASPAGLTDVLPTPVNRYLTTRIEAVEGGIKAISSVDAPWTVVIASDFDCVVGLLKDKLDRHRKLHNVMQAHTEHLNRVQIAMALELCAIAEALGIAPEQQQGGSGESIRAIQQLNVKLAELELRHA
ncbi:hypothetical protein H4C80_00475 [Pseudomonas juntendi]|uniref:Uncharacterized protein n=1 Tax=Pseudomonas juntendi TaxID=2666183 RepID=A0A7W2Q710_9PSED|nr:hypothetical protein [Pseudomonas juntendi]MBA6095624.1 hypothetical protein [Pseudomonas juntendi]